MFFGLRMVIFFGIFLVSVFFKKKKKNFIFDLHTDEIESMYAEPALQLHNQWIESKMIENYETLTKQTILSSTKMNVSHSNRSHCFTETDALDSRFHNRISVRFCLNWMKLFNFSLTNFLLALSLFLSMSVSLCLAGWTMYDVLFSFRRSYRFLMMDESHNLKRAKCKRKKTYRTN